ncbi:MAG TPA: bifunctional glutamate N-acetyltransferase/amino-acid acetyltransferase ArgJ [Aquifex aeolicus]|uniref:Arginine biosynthesis bifunctional protein ArgJ n=1 Tax=Aquifex aeolicus TaxID=63363 RepID=A0A9D1CGI0_AQUAO|nr:bifunctional glutamate N-acetyltransferase/amino-acid acetyltransferase ArgJ [Aquifex aeolicus]HIQ26752.1 bifunctional glutamate N-acetyltransferase/amino-acid acetyltransferase ArgJ [Aquifex aeolicus]
MQVLMGTARAGIKPSGKKDLLVVFFEKPVLVSAVYTKNHFKAAPVIYSKGLTDKRKLFRAFVVNSGNANCGTGKEGLKHAQMMAQRVAQNLDIKPEEVLVFSTGLIGALLPIGKVLVGIDRACSELKLLNLREAAEAISTTDRFPKYAQREYAFGFGKGAGMIHPNMGTMLAYIFTPAKLNFNALREIHSRVTEKTFNSITVDGCTSTNDSFLLISLGEEEIPVEKVEKDTFEVAEAISKLIVADGEGATKIGVIKIVNAVSEEKAKALAERVATSLLVKTALFGCDPNWGRIAQAVGSLPQYPVDPDRLDIYIGNYPLLVDGTPTNTNLEEVAQYMRKNKEIPIMVDLKEGHQSWTYYTSDLTYDYVKLNAEYTT